MLRCKRKCSEVITPLATKIRGAFPIARLAWAQSWRCKSSRELTTANEVKRNCARVPAERTPLVDPGQVAPTLAVSCISDELLDGEPGINCVRLTVV
jgi:hypothetical protein